MEQSPWKARRSSTNQEIPRISWKPEVHYSIPKSVSLSRTISVWSTSPYCFLQIHFNSSYLRLKSSKWSLSLGLPHQNSVCISSLLIVLYNPAHRLVLDLITHIIFGRSYRSLSSACSLFPLHLIWPKAT